MRFRLPSAVAVAVAALLVPALARADDEEETATNVTRSKWLFVEGTLGIGTPVGWAGGELVVVPWPSLAIHGGAGAGSQGIQLEAGGRGRVEWGSKMFGAGASWSTGPFVGVATSAFPLPEMGAKHPMMLHWDRAHFANVELSLESESRVTIVRGFLGMGYALNADDATVLEGSRCGPKTSCSRLSARLLPFFGVAVAFGVL